MQCPQCGTLLPTGTTQCASCGVMLPPQPAGQEDVNKLPYAQGERWQSTPAPPPLPSTPPSNIYGAPVAPPPPLYGESGWSEYSGMPNTMSTSSDATYPAFAGPQYPGFIQPVPPPAKHRGPSLAIILLLSILALLLISGGVVAGVLISQSRNGAISARSATPTPPDPAQQLYRQVMSKNPTLVDALNDPSISQWSVAEHPLSGCEVKSDGLHVHINNLHHFFYCTSGRGKFTNFAFQVDMKILSGQGGITFRGDTVAGNLYYIRFLPDSSYTISTEQNNQFSSALALGIATTFTTGFGQTNTVTMIAQGRQMYFYTNQKFFSQISDSTYTTGFIGLLADDNTKASEVVYMNAKIWML